MQAAEKANLYSAAAQFGGKYVNEKFKSGKDVEKGTVATYIAHGYCMGAQCARDTLPTPKRGLFWSLFKMPRWCIETDPIERAGLKQAWLSKKISEAVKEYVKGKGYERITPEEFALLRATFGVGFKKGFETSESPS